MCNSGFDFDFVPDVEERESDESECCARIEVRGSSQLNRISSRLARQVLASYIAESQAQSRRQDATRIVTRIDTRKSEP